MKSALARIEELHEALIEALDANDVSAIEATSRALEADLVRLKGVGSWADEPELKLAAERIGRLGEAAMMRVNVLNDQAHRRAESVAELRG